MGIGIFLLFSMSIDIFLFFRSLCAALFLHPTCVRHGVVVCIHNHICEITSYMYLLLKPSEVFFANMQDMLAATLPDIESEIMHYSSKNNISSI